MHQKEQNKQDISLTKEVNGLYTENKTVARETEDPSQWKTVHAHWL